MRIGELAKRSGFSRDAIRLMSAKGSFRRRPGKGTITISPIRKMPLMTLEVLRDAQAAGVSIGDLSIILSQYGSGEDYDGDVFLAEKIAEVEARIVASERFLKTLRQTRAALAIAPLDE